MKVVAAALVVVMNLRREMVRFVFINFDFRFSIFDSRRQGHKDEAAARSQKTVTSGWRWRNEAGKWVVTCGCNVRLSMAVLVGPLTRRSIFREDKMSPMPRVRPIRGLRFRLASMECFCDWAVSLET